MTPVFLTERARQDIADIQTYYNDVSPRSGGKVLGDIYDMFEILSRWPEIGRAFSGDDFRQIATAK